MLGLPDKNSGVGPIVWHGGDGARCFIPRVSSCVSPAATQRISLFIVFGAGGRPDSEEVGGGRGVAGTGLPGALVGRAGRRQAFTAIFSAPVVKACSRLPEIQVSCRQDAAAKTRGVSGELGCEGNVNYGRSSAVHTDCVTVRCIVAVAMSSTSN